MKVGQRYTKNNDHRKKTDPFYQSGDWRVLVELVWQRDEAQCQECNRQGIMKPLTKPSRDINYQGHVDHIKPRELGGKDTLDNLELLCYHCHASKSAMEKRPPLTGQVLIHVVGNIASGKSTLCQQLQDITGYEYKEINDLSPNQHPKVILESSGLGWKVNYITKRFNKVFTIMCYCDDATTLTRLQYRERNGYQYPNNKRSPLAFYNHVKEDIRYVEYDLFIDTANGYDINDVIGKIR